MSCSTGWVARRRRASWSRRWWCRTRRTWRAPRTATTCASSPSCRRSSAPGANRRPGPVRTSARSSSCSRRVHRSWRQRCRRERVVEMIMLMTVAMAERARRDRVAQPRTRARRADVRREPHRRPRRRARGTRPRSPLNRSTLAVVGFAVMTAPAGSDRVMFDARAGEPPQSRDGASTRSRDGRWP